MIAMQQLVILENICHVMGYLETTDGNHQAAISKLQTAKRLLMGE